MNPDAHVVQVMLSKRTIMNACDGIADVKHAAALLGFVRGLLVSPRSETDTTPLLPHATIMFHPCLGVLDQLMQMCHHMVLHYRPHRFGPPQRCLWPIGATTRVLIVQGGTLVISWQAPIVAIPVAENGRQRPFNHQDVQNQVGHTLGTVTTVVAKSSLFLVARFQQRRSRNSHGWPMPFE